MLIKLEQIESAPDKELNIDIKEDIELQGVKIPVKACLLAKATDYGVNIKGRVKADIQLECDRCLKEYQFNLDTLIDENFVNDKIVPEFQKEFELKETDFVEELGEKEEIDITDLIYQSLVLEIPQKKLCDEECPGSEDYQELLSEEHIDERLEVFKTFAENNLNNDDKE